MELENWFLLILVKGSLHDKERLTVCLCSVVGIII